MATIFGQDLSNVDGIVNAGVIPLPTQLADVTVLVNGIAAPLLSVAYVNGENQISFQTPFETDTGQGAVTIEVQNDGNSVATITADSYTEDPGIFVYNGYGLAIRNADGSIITASNPANPGDILVLYATGLGPVSVNVPDGEAGPSDPPADTVDPFQAMIAGEQCTVLFSGLAPGFAGLYQLNLVLPSDLPAGDLDMQISTPYANSGIVKLPVQ